jgi:hypothetical protein
MITMTLEELKSKPIREQVEYIFDKLDSDDDDDDDIQSLKEIISEYNPVLNSVRKFNRECGIYLTEKITLSDEKFREIRVEHMVEFQKNYIKNKLELQ